jgi:hypothetical protein
VTTPQKQISTPRTSSNVAMVTTPLSSSTVSTFPAMENKKRPHSTVKKEDKENAGDNVSSVTGPPSTTRAKRSKRRRIEILSDTAKQLNLNKL